MILAGPPNNHTHTSGRWTSAPWTRRTLHTAPAGRKLQTWSSFFGFFHATYCSSLFNGAIASAHWRIQLASIEYCGIMRLAQPLYALVYKVLVGDGAPRTGSTSLLQRINLSRTNNVDKLTQLRRKQSPYIMNRVDAGRHTDADGAVLIIRGTQSTGHCWFVIILSCNLNRLAGFCTRIN